MNTCLKTASLFVLSEAAQAAFTCAATLTGCASCTTSAAKCASCTATTHVFDKSGACVAFATGNCSVAPTAGVCVTCKTGYTLTDAATNNTTDAFKYCASSSFLKASIMVVAVLGSMMAL